MWTCLAWGSYCCNPWQEWNVSDRALLLQPCHTSQCQNSPWDWHFIATTYKVFMVRIKSNVNKEGVGTAIPQFSIKLNFKEDHWFWFIKITETTRTCSFFHLISKYLSIMLKRVTTEHTAQRTKHRLETGVYCWKITGEANLGLSKGKNNCKENN